jgi:hypothetical protein
VRRAVRTMVLDGHYRAPVFREKQQAISSHATRFQPSCGTVDDRQETGQSLARRARGFQLRPMRNTRNKVEID